MNNFLCNNYSDNSLFVQCDCGGEIMEISLYGVDDGYVHFSTHSWYDRKKCKYCDFSLSLGDFKDLIFYVTLSEADCVYHNVSVGKNNPQLLRMNVCSGFVSFALYKNMKHLKKNDAVWEVIVGESRLCELKRQLDKLMNIVNKRLYGKEKNKCN